MVALKFDPDAETPHHKKASFGPLQSSAPFWETKKEREERGSQEENHKARPLTCTSASVVVIIQYAFIISLYVRWMLTEASAAAAIATLELGERSVLGSLRTFPKCYLEQMHSVRHQSDSIYTIYRYRRFFFMCLASRHGQELVQNAKSFGLTREPQIQIHKSFINPNQEMVMASPRLQGGQEAKWGKFQQARCSIVCSYVAVLWCRHFDFLDSNSLSTPVHEPCVRCIARSHLTASFPAFCLVLRFEEQLERTVATKMHNAEVHGLA